MKETIINKLKNNEDLTKEEINFITKSFNQEKKYGLVWEDHPESVDLELKDGLFNIEEIKSREIKKDINGRQNLLLEGDNLHSLMALKEAGIKVDVIYIDPPYNTMNEEGFIYNDKKIDSNDNYRHSKWLSFMHKRLQLARDLMTEDGVIFVSIDDNEQANLKLLMDNVFGEDLFVSNIIRKENSKKQKIGKPNLKNEHEYLLVYTKNIKHNAFKYVIDEYYSQYEKYCNDLFHYLKNNSKTPEVDFNKIIKGCVPNSISITDSLQKIIKKIYALHGMFKGLESYKYIDQNGLFRDADINLSLGSGHKYSIENPFNSNKFLNAPKHFLPDKKVFLKSKMFKENKSGNLEFVNKENIVEIEEGKFAYSNIIFKEDTIIRYKEYIDITNPTSSLWLNNMGSDDKLMQNMNLNFSYPKPKEYIKKIISQIFNTDATVLDFFAGSGTTGQAVMELNKEDGGNRRFILCTNNENNICEEVTYERIRRVITGEYATKIVDPLPANLSYFKIDIEQKDSFNYVEKETRLNKNLIYYKKILNEMSIVEETYDYAMLKDNKDNKILIITSVYINDNIKDVLNTNSFKEIHVPKHLIKDKAFLNIDSTLVNIENNK